MRGDSQAVCEGNVKIYFLDKQRHRIDTMLETQAEMEMSSAMTVSAPAARTRILVPRRLYHRY